MLVESLDSVSPMTQVQVDAQVSEYLTRVAP